jgi:hypothetical protein
MTMTFVRPPRAASEGGVVARLSAGGWTAYHQLDCDAAPRRGAPGVRDLIHGPWRYLAAHWAPCPRCRPPRAVEREAA